MGVINTTPWHLPFGEGRSGVNRPKEMSYDLPYLLVFKNCIQLLPIHEYTYVYVTKFVDLRMGRGHHLSCFFLKKKRRSDDHGTTEK